MNIDDIRPGMQVRVKTFDELKAEGKIAHSGHNFVDVVSFGFLNNRTTYLGGIFRVEKIFGPSVYLGSCYYETAWVNDLIWWHPDLLVPVEDPTELESETDKAEFSLFLDEFIQK